MTQLVLSELRQVSSKFDNFRHTDSQNDKLCEVNLGLIITFRYVVFTDPKICDF